MRFFKAHTDDIVFTIRSAKIPFLLSVQVDLALRTAVRSAKITFLQEEYFNDPFFFGKGSPVSERISW